MAGHDFLERLIDSRKQGEPLHITGIHDALSAKISTDCGFEALWASGLGMALTHAKPDANILSHTEVANIVSHMVDATAYSNSFNRQSDSGVGQARLNPKAPPIIVDGDTGHGEWPIAVRFVQELAKAGASGVVLEDKKFPKRNSFQENSPEDLEDVGVFCQKLEAVKSAVPEMFLGARLEGFIVKAELQNTLERAQCYAQAGADALIVHSKRTDGAEIRQFLQEWDQSLPVIIIPTTYAEDIPKQGVAGVISANQVLRSMVPALVRTYQALQTGGVDAIATLNDDIATLKHVFKLTGDESLNDLMVGADKKAEGYRNSGNSLAKKLTI